MEHHVNLVHNIPFFSVFFAMFCGIITPLLKSGRAARHLHGFMVGLVGILSVVLGERGENQEAYILYDGAFSCTFGAMNCASGLWRRCWRLWSVWFMFLTITAGSRQIFEEIVPKNKNFTLLC